MEGYMPKHKGLKLLILGIVLVLVRLYTLWDMWVVIGTLLIIMGLLKLLMPSKCCTKAPAAKKK